MRWLKRALLLSAAATCLSAAELKRRVLVLPFDNLKNNKNVAWLSDNIADNLKTNLLAGNAFEILDVTLLRKIDPSMQFKNLTADRASAFARRLNCEVAVVGRYTARSVGKQLEVSFEAEAVDALEERSVVILRRETIVDAAIFDQVSSIAEAITGDLKAKLKPLDAKSYKRDNRVEKLIRRIENPPKGFLDDLQVKGFVLKPAFDIDTFDYEINFTYRDVEDYPEIELRHVYWGREYEPGLAQSRDLKCKGSKCKITGQNPLLVFTKTTQEGGLAYKVKLNLPDPRGPIIGRWWLSAGYPYLTSFEILGQENPAAFEPPSKMPLQSMRGYAQLEAGLLPGRWQFLPKGVRYALVAQASYAQGMLSIHDADNPPTLRLHLISYGGGLRFDRLLQINRTWGVAPFAVFSVHQQRFLRDLTGAAATIVGFSPEIGVTNYFRLARKTPWRYLVSVAAGAYLYAGQNLAYFRLNLGAEYVIK